MADETNTTPAAPAPAPQAVQPVQPVNPIPTSAAPAAPFAAPAPAAPVLPAGVPVDAQPVSDTDALATVQANAWNAQSASAKANSDAPQEAAPGLMKPVARKPKFPFYRDLASGDVYRALRTPAGYEDEHPELYEGVSELPNPAATEE
jgi:hypothetical protein